MRKRILKSIIAVVLLLLCFGGCKTEETDAELVFQQPYYSKQEVALYLHTYQQLPPNYLTKSQATALGWQADKGNLWEVTDHGCIGGDVFGNWEKKLPVAANRIYYECDVDYEGGYRSSHRLIYSNDDLIYYTGDHYTTFEQLY